MINRDLFGQWFNKEVQARWKRLNLSWTELGDWHWRLGGFDLDTLTQAVRRHKACDDWRVPSLKKVYDCAKAIQAGRQSKQPTETQSSGIPATHTFIMCTARDDDKAGRLGWFVDILICPLSRTYPPEAYQRAAAAQARRHSDAYGGVWEVFTGTTHGDMLKRAGRLRSVSGHRKSPQRQ